MSTGYQAVKLTPEAATLLRQESYRLTGKLQRKITLSETVILLCQADEANGNASTEERQ